MFVVVVLDGQWLVSDVSACIAIPIALCLFYSVASFLRNVLKQL